MKIARENIVLLVAMLLALVLTACHDSSEYVGDGLAQQGSDDFLLRDSVDMEFVAGVNGDADSAGKTGANGGAKAGMKRVAYAYDDNSTPDDITDDKLSLSWENEERIGVYIKTAGDAVVKAGSLVSYAAVPSETRTFSGKVMAKRSTEKYLYMYPDMLVQNSIDYTRQSGTVNSAAHLKNLVPIIWEESGEADWNLKPKKKANAIRLVLKFKSDPGRLKTVSLQTMKMGPQGETPDKIFPKWFRVSKMAEDVNNVVKLTDDETAAGKTFVNGLSLGERGVDYTDIITLAINNKRPADNGDGTYMADVYLASGQVKNLDVFRTKFNVKVVAENGEYNCPFKSLPGQESATAASGLKSLQNGKVYTMEAKMSKGHSTTVVSVEYGVNSLLGMWSRYGKPYDQMGGVVADADRLPSQLRNVIGDEEKRAAFSTRLVENLQLTSSGYQGLWNRSSQGTPQFTWDMLQYQVADGRSNLQQADVTYNNITVIEETEVFLTFVSEYAWSQNLLGYYHYPTATVPASANDVTKNIVFPNLSKGGHVPYNLNGSENIANVNPNTSAQNVSTADDAPLKEYTTVQLLYIDDNGFTSTRFPAGTTIGFFMMRDSKASSQAVADGSTDVLDHTGYTPRADNTLLDWAAWRLFTNTAWNETTVGTVRNYFVSADVCRNGTTSPEQIPGIAMYGAKDSYGNPGYAFSAMLFMVSTSVPSAMQTSNQAYYNLTAGQSHVVKK